MENFEERECVTLHHQGLKLFSMIHKPLSKTPCPAVFVCHGFAGNKCGRHRIYVNMSTSLSKSGIASMRMDFRGAGDSEGELVDTTIESQVSDALLALHFLEKLPFVDPTRIGILGRSLGGAIAILAASRYKKAKSIALWSPVFHAKQWAEEWAEAMRKLQNNVSPDIALRTHGFVTGKGFVKELFEMNVEKELPGLSTTPLLHIHGEKDTTVKLDHAEDFVRARKKSPGLSRFVRLPEGDHDFTQIDVQREAIEETRKWFKETLYT